MTSYIAFEIVCFWFSTAIWDKYDHSLTKYKNKSGTKGKPFHEKLTWCKKNLVKLSLKYICFIIYLTLIPVILIDPAWGGAGKHHPPLPPDLFLDLAPLCSAPGHAHLWWPAAGHAHPHGGPGGGAGLLRLPRPLCPAHQDLPGSCGWIWLVESFCPLSSLAHFLASVSRDAVESDWFIFLHNRAPDWPDASELLNIGQPFPVIDHLTPVRFILSIFCKLAPKWSS